MTENKYAPVAHETIIPRTSVMKFARLMEVVLRANDHKTGWSAMPLHQLCDRAADELLECAEACDLPDDEYAPHAAAVEAADVANFMMMVHDNISRTMAGVCGCGCLAEVGIGAIE